MSIVGSANWKPIFIVANTQVTTELGASRYKLWHLYCPHFISQTSRGLFLTVHRSSLLSEARSWHLRMIIDVSPASATSPRCSCKRHWALNWEVRFCFLHFPPCLTPAFLCDNCIASGVNPHLCPIISLKSEALIFSVIFPLVEAIYIHQYLHECNDY